MYCGPHGKEYGELTRAYKELSAEVEDLRAIGWLPPNEWTGLQTIQDVELAIERAERWQDKIPEEIEARRTHHGRFFPTQRMLLLSRCGYMRSLVFSLSVALSRSQGTRDVD